MKIIVSLFIIISCFSCATNSNEDIANLEAKLASMEEKLNKATKEKNPNRYYNKNLGFSAIAPTEWEIKENYQGIPVFFMSPLENEEDLFQENINIVSENAPGYTLQQYYEANLRGIDQYLTDFELLENPVNITINGQKFKKIVYQHTAQTYKLKVSVFFTVKNDTGYVINCTALTHSFDRYNSDFNNFAESFKFE